jgi:cell division protein FtsW
VRIWGPGAAATRGWGESRFAERLRSYDRTIATAAALLLLAGFILSLAASPTATAREGYSEAFRFSWRHAGFALAGLSLFAGAASLSPKGVRRISLLIYLLCIALMFLVLMIGAETKGAQRWLHVGALSLQPSEFLKPALVVLGAWMLSERMKSPAFPGLTAVGGMFGIAAALLLAQPDVGQTALLTLTLAAMLFTAGVSWVWLAGGAGAAGATLLVLYHVSTHVKARFDVFFHVDGVIGYQVSQALEAIQGGGMLGRGPGEGIFKQRLPDAHSDFIYAVSAEEFGVLASVGLIWLYGLIAWRGLGKSARLADPFSQLAATGLISMFALQAAIHIAVNLSLMPAKGMTLPLVSYGGSSMLGSAVTLGFALALLRWRQGGYIYDQRLAAASARA